MQANAAPDAIDLAIQLRRIARASALSPDEQVTALALALGLAAHLADADLERAIDVARASHLANATAPNARRVVA